MSIKCNFCIGAGENQIIIEDAFELEENQLEEFNSCFEIESKSKELSDEEIEQLEQERIIEREVKKSKFKLIK